MLDLQTSLAVMHPESLNTEHNEKPYLKYSVPVSPGLYAHNPEYFSRFKPRVHRNSQTADDASVQCQIDVLGEGRVGEVLGNLSLNSGGFQALNVPGCLPDRLAIVAYVGEIAFLHDGKF